MRCIEGVRCRGVAGKVRCRRGALKGCGGKGHRYADCTTVNPHLKGGKGGGKSQGGWNKGSWQKGFGGKGKGKGAKGKGKGYGKNQAFSFDSLWSQPEMGLRQRLVLD